MHICWHQNYGQFAQARLSYLKRDSESGKYALQLLERDKDQYGFSKLMTFVFNGKEYVAALGNKTLIVYGPEGRWEKKAIYSRHDEPRIFDVARIPSDGGKAVFVVLDGTLRVVELAL
jgi:hypothetical protein